MARSRRSGGSRSGYRRARSATSPRRVSRRVSSRRTSVRSASARTIRLVIQHEAAPQGLVLSPEGQSLVQAPASRRARF